MKTEKTVKQRVAAMQKAVKLQEQVLQIVRDSKLAGSSIEDLDIDNLVYDINGTLLQLELRVNAIPRRIEKIKKGEMT